MTRRCSHCSNNGRNSRTRPSRGALKLFGLRLTDGSIKNSANIGNLPSANYHSSSSSPHQGSPLSNPLSDTAPVAEGYASDDLAHASRIPTQVASHAQKYFIRQSNCTRRKRRSSLYDMIHDVSAEPLSVMEEQFLLRSPIHRAENMNSADSGNCFE